ncbi:MAG: hypothetical protein JSU00_06545 [Acidobacteria bacterium]|nr:hypothetical protein [Acidobacteriota bacterium]
MSEPSTRDPVIELLDNTQRDTNELVSALCQVQTDRVRELIGRDLRDQIVQILESRFSQLELTLRPRMARARLEVARGLAQVLNECFMRMRRFESDRHWCDAMLDAASAMCRRCAFFSVRGADLCIQGARGLDAKAAFPPAEIPYSAAPAFDRVIATAKSFQAARCAAELSAPIANMFGAEGEGRALLAPIITEERVPGVLYAEDTVDPSAIELIAALAGAILEKHLKLFEPVRSTSGATRAVSVRKDDEPAPPPDPARTLEIAAPAPPRAEDPAQLAAERFARVEVARLLLANPPAISRGRRDRNLYATLRPAIDALRSAYHVRFHGVRDSLHLELVRTLALGDASLLGREYPGPVS